MVNGPLRAILAVGVCSDQVIHRAAPHHRDKERSLADFLMDIFSAKRRTHERSMAIVPSLVYEQLIIHVLRNNASWLLIQRVLFLFAYKTFQIAPQQSKNNNSPTFSYW